MPTHVSDVPRVPNKRTASCGKNSGYGVRAGGEKYFRRFSSWPFLLGSAPPSNTSTGVMLKLRNNCTRDTQKLMYLPPIAD